MKSKLYVKILALCVVLCFIGIGIQPAFAIDIKQSISKDETEECEDCKELSNAELVKVKQLINRVEVYSKLLLVLARDNPELRYLSEELSDKIAILKEEITNGPPFPIICATLEYIILFVSYMPEIFDDWMQNSSPLKMIIAWIYSRTIIFFVYPIFVVTFIIGVYLACWDYPYWP